jgi:hypothetical protein
MEATIQTSAIQPVFQKIHEIRGYKVMLDYDLAELYGVETKILNKAVKRNLKRFPADFMFQLTRKEHHTILRFQIETLSGQFVENEKNMCSRFQFGTLNTQFGVNEQNIKSNKRGSNIKYLPYAFTEQGIAMLSGILNSDRAISVNIAIMRAFVALRQYALNYVDLNDRLEEFMKSTDSNFSEVFSVLEELMTQKKLYENRKPIGFNV